MAIHSVSLGNIFSEDNIFQVSSLYLPSVANNVKGMEKSFELRKFVVVIDSW